MDNLSYFIFFFPETVGLLLTHHAACAGDDFFIIYIAKQY